MAGKGVKKMYRTVRVLTFYMDLYNGRKKGHPLRQPSKIRHIKLMLQLLYVPGITFNFPAQLHGICSAFYLAKIHLAVPEVPSLLPGPHGSINPEGTLGGGQQYRAYISLIKHDQCLGFFSYHLHYMSPIFTLIVLGLAGFFSIAPIFSR